MENIKIVKNVSGEGLGAEIVQYKWETCVGALGPKRVYHFYCAILTPRPHPDTMFAPFSYFISFALYLVMDCYKDTLLDGAREWETK